MPDPIRATCRRDYFPAYHDSGWRALSTIRWIVLHDEEAPTASSSAAYFQNPESGGSAHLCVDGDTCYRCLANDTIPWGARSSFGANLHGVHVEMAGLARWSSVVWRAHLRTLQRAAWKTAQHCHGLHVPPVFVPAASLPRVSGVTTHREVSAASRRLDPAHAVLYDHSDPGPLWPRALFMRLVRGYYVSG